MPYDSTPESAAAPPPLPDETPKPVAPWWHTLGLFGLLTLSTLYTHHRAAEPVVSRPHIPSYLVSIALEWILLGLVFAGVYRKRAFLATAFRNRERGWFGSLGAGLMTYFLGFMAIALTGGALYFTPLFHKRNEAVVLAMVPHRPLEFVVWFGVSLTAGICEELIFRGYLLQQLTAWTRRPVLSIVLAALLFGSVHLYEGLGAILPLAALAVAYGFVVRFYKGDLRGVIVAHTLQDFVVAFIMLARPYLERYQPK